MGFHELSDSGGAMIDGLLTSVLEIGQKSLKPRLRSTQEFRVKSNANPKTKGQELSIN